MKISKEYRNQLEGMNFALRYAKEHGIEELEAEVKRRGAYEMPLQLPRHAIRKAEEQLAQTTIETVCLMAVSCVRDTFGIGKERMERFLDKFAIRTQCLCDGDIAWEDLQEQIKEEIGLELDISALVKGHRTGEALKRQNEAIVKTLEEKS